MYAQQNTTAKVAQDDQAVSQFGGSTVRDFAKRWAIPESSVWLKIAQKKINVVRLGPRHTRITREEEARLSREGVV